jgi:hypothetical protein
VTPALDPERRQALVGAKLRALVAAHDGDGATAEVVAFAGGAGLHTPTATWVLVSSATAGLGAVLAWAGTRPPTAGRAPVAVSVVVDDDAIPRAGTLARQAGAFADAPTVWRVEGRALALAAAVPPPVAPPPVPAALGRIDELRAAGLDVVVEHGVVRGEVDGLEVAVVTVGDDGEAHIEVGVGRNDREAFALLHGDLTPAEALRRVADTVRRHRRAGAIVHPLNRMAPERWLRARMRADPRRLPGWSLDPAPAPEPRTGVADGGPAFAFGNDGAGRPVVLACSVGIDLELVPTAADARAALDPDARLVLAMPARDAHPVTRRLAAALARPADVLALDGDWRG